MESKKKPTTGSASHSTKKEEAKKSETAKTGTKTHKIGSKTDKGEKKESRIQAELNQLSVKVVEIQQKNTEYEEMIKRQQAEFDNYRKRINDERANILKYASDGLLKDFLKIYDNFEKAVDVEVEGEELKKFLAGFSLIKDQLDKMLESHGVKSSTQTGDEFNPELQQAIQVEDKGGSVQKVAEIFQRGYFLHDRLLREAVVKIEKVD